jgi:DNA-binding protein H-NS
MPSLNDLISQKTALDKQIAELQRAGRAAAVSQIRSLMGEYGLNLGDVLTAAEKRKLTSGNPATVSVAAPMVAPAKPGRKPGKAGGAAKSAKAAKAPKAAGQASRAGKPLGKVAIKYRDAATGDSWTGRGLKPRWLQAQLAAGRKIEEFAV